jgi:hypothetical protein
VQSVVSDHHGKISVESAPGVGATFRIELPVKPPEAEANHGFEDTVSGGRGTNGDSGENEPAREDQTRRSTPRAELASVTKSTLGLDN